MFRLDSATRIVADQKFPFAADYLAQLLKAHTGLSLQVAASPEGGSNQIVFRAVPRAAEDTLDESYELDVRPSAVEISAKGDAGALYGAITFVQMAISCHLLSSNKNAGQIDLPCSRISDAPAFKWRGFLLDVARHYFPAPDLVKVVDGLALHKLNRFQLHLTDDQGWRFEVKAYPKLTEVGAWRTSAGFNLPEIDTPSQTRGRYGGFYTQQQMRELVAYAAARNIQVVPEIEVPGHATAALAAYPELGCTGEQVNVETNAGVFQGVFCAGNDETFRFLETVFAEVMEVFPGQFIHVGGDEVPKKAWRNCAKCQRRIKENGLKDEEELQAWFMAKVEGLLRSKGRRMIGWSEVLHEGLSTNVVLMDWIGGGQNAAARGHDVIMSPTKHCYLDFYQGTNRVVEPKGTGGFLPLSQAYAFQPKPADLLPEFTARIMGGQANLWTEYIPDIRHAEYMMYPRLSAIAEVLWSGPGKSDYQAFRERMLVHEKRLRAFGINSRSVTTDGE